MYNLGFSADSDINSLFQEILFALLAKQDQPDAHLDVLNLFAIINLDTIIVSEKLQQLLKRTTYGRKYGYAAIEGLFLAHALSFYQGLPDSVLADLAHHEGKHKVILFSLSARAIPQQASTINGINDLDMPGNRWHRDGRAIPLATKITMLSSTPFKTGGELYVTNFNELLQGSLPTRESDYDTLRLKKFETIIFDNIRLMHAVNAKFPTFTSKHKTFFRSLMQERINVMQASLANILFELGLTFSPTRKTPCGYKTLLASYLNPKNRGRFRYKTDVKQYSAAELEYLECEKPLDEIETTIKKLPGHKAKTLVSKLKQDGVLIFPGLLQPEILAGMQRAFAYYTAGKSIDPFLQQVAFSCSADANIHLDKFSYAALNQAWLLMLMTQYFGRPAILSSFRGYRLYPRESLLYRAWDWHNDQKRKEVKVMFILEDLSADGQAMQVIKGSHQHWWNMSTQADTIYTMDEAASFGQQTLTKCFGPAGTMIMFDTNIAHRGIRNLGPTRTVITMNFVPDSERSPLFPVLIDPLAQEPTELYEKFALRYSSQERFTADQKISLAIDYINQKSTLVERQLDTIKVITDASQDYSGAQLAMIKEQYYHTPRIADFKTRYDGTENFHSTIQEISSCDLQNDLDLPIRPGNGDVERDIQLVVYRDAGTQAKAFRSTLYSSLAQVKLAKKDILSLEELIALATMLESLSAGIMSQQIKRVHMLAGDLKQALMIVDSVQRLRTTLLQLYGVCYSVSTYLSDTKKLTYMQSRLLETYSCLVYMDDLCRYDPGIC